MHMGHMPAGRSLGRSVGVPSAADRRFPGLDAQRTRRDRITHNTAASPHHLSEVLWSARPGRWNRLAAAPAARCVNALGGRADRYYCYYFRGGGGRRPQGGGARSHVFGLAGGGGEGAGACRRCYYVYMPYLGGMRSLFQRFGPPGFPSRQRGAGNLTSGSS